MVPNHISRKYTISEVAMGIEFVIGHKMTLLEASDLIGCYQMTLRKWIKKHYYNKAEKQREVEMITLQSKINNQIKE